MTWLLERLHVVSDVEQRVAHAQHAVEGHDKFRADADVAEGVGTWLGQQVPLAEGVRGGHRWTYYRGA